MHQPRAMYNALFTASWETIDTLSKDHKYLGAKMGMTAVLHTWSQTLGLHPHLHCIVPGGGVSKSGKWRSTRSQGKYLFPSKVLCILFRSIYLRELKRLRAAGVIDIPQSMINKLYRKRWVVYAKRPFAKPAHVIEYLGRYTHKVAISNYRLLQVSDTHVTFTWKDYRHGAARKVMTLSIGEFVRRFSLHILPHRYVRIRHYGILSCHGRRRVIPDLQVVQGYVVKVDLVVERPKMAPLRCPRCHSHDVQVIDLPKTRSP